MPALAHKLIVDPSAQPWEVVISYALFQHLQEVLGADITAQEEEELREAIRDSENGNTAAFVPMEELMR